MKWIADITQPKPLHFVIEASLIDNLSDNVQETWYDVLVYENGNNTHDYQQETLEDAQDFALQKFNVPLNAWRQVE